LQEVQRWEWVQANVPELANDNFAFECVFGRPAFSRIPGLIPGGFAATTSG
jgi:hypothetical protein